MKVGSWRAGVARCGCAALMLCGFAATCGAGGAAAATWPDLSRAGKRVGGGENDAAVIVAIEDYVVHSTIPGARANAEDWLTYLVQQRGVPRLRVQMLQDREGTVEKVQTKLSQAIDDVKPGGTLWFVFIGHGAPSLHPTSGEPDGLLVGFDAQDDVESLQARSLRQSDVLTMVRLAKAERHVVLVDACFSGRTGPHGEDMLVAGLQPFVVVEPTLDRSRTLVLSAAKASQFAGPLPGASRPAFSYLALGALRGWADGATGRRDGYIDAEELVTYVQDALRKLGSAQQPELFPSSGGARSAPLVSSSGESAPELGALLPATRSAARPSRGAPLRVESIGRHQPRQAGLAAAKEDREGWLLNDRLSQPASSTRASGMSRSVDD